MANKVSDPSKAGRSDPHGWNSLKDYLYQHRKRCDDYPAFVEDWVLEHELLAIGGQQFLLLTGQIKCRDGLILDISKIAEVRERRARKECRTIYYSYNCHIRSKGNIFRYDNDHTHLRHPTAHHKHIYDPPDTQIVGSPIHVGPEGWPHMHQVIEEMSDWRDSRLEKK